MGRWSIWTTFTRARSHCRSRQRSGADGVDADYAGIVEYVTDPIVSSDVKQSSYSSTYDSAATMVLGGHLVKTISWFDNGWGYAHRVVELIEYVAKLEGEKK